jgi:putative RecB family exonuclease
LKTFDECPQRFRYKYIDKIPEPKAAPSPAMEFGTIIHDTLELLYKKIQSSGTILTKKQLNTHIQEKMVTFRDAYDAVSETPLSSEIYTDYLNLSTEMIDRYYDTYAPFDQTKVNGLESNISFELPNTQTFTGKIDRFDIAGDMGIIVDYKTDKSIASYDTFVETYQQQLNSYAVWVMKNYHHAIKSLKGKLIYLRLAREVEREITPEMIEKAVITITDKIAKIEDTLFHYNMGERDAF